jgi:hypothetical protein
MKQIFTIIISTVFIFISCQTDKRKGTQERKNIAPFPIVIDTFGIEELQVNFEKEPTWLTTANYRFYYIGTTKDTIYLDPFVTFSPPPPPPPGTKPSEIIDYKNFEIPFKEYYIDWLEEKEFKNWEQTEIEIRIDTTTVFLNYYPVLLTNSDIDTTFIGYGSKIPIIMEALDSLGNWKPIQEKFAYFCGVGVGSVILPPNESVLTLAPIFKGNYKTKLRLKLGNNYSKPFYGFINHRQFQSKFNEHGDYKDEYKREMTEK